MDINSNAFIVGLTGMSGSGKSTIAKIFAECGYYVIDADKVSRTVASMPAFLDEMSQAFPECVVNGVLDRKVTASIVFSDLKKLNSYTSIIYPYIAQLIFDAIAQAKSEGHKYILLDAPTLFESELDYICNTSVIVIADYDLLLERIIARDGITREMARLRLRAKIDEESETNRADYLIQNYGTFDELREETLSTIAQIKEQFNV